MAAKEASAKAESRPGPEHRQHARAQYQVEVTLESESNFYNGFTENISAGGLFVATYDTREIGELLTMELALPGREAPLSLHGEVRWIRELNPLTPDMTPGMGVRFIDIPSEAVEAIEAFTKQKDPLFYDDE